MSRKKQKKQKNGKLIFGLFIKTVLGVLAAIGLPIIYVNLFLVLTLYDFGMLLPSKLYEPMPWKRTLEYQSLEEYSGSGQRSTDNYIQDEIYQIFYKENNMVSSLGEFYMVPNAPILVEWTGISSLGEKIGRFGSLIMISDAEEEHQLYARVMPGGFLGKEFTDSFSKMRWTSMADPIIPYKKDGYFHHSSTDELTEVVFEVQNLKEHGYVKIILDYDKHLMYRFLYVENQDVYSNNRALKTAESLKCPEEAIRMLAEETVIEMDDGVTKLCLEDYMEGCPYFLAKCEWNTYQVDLDVPGTYELDITCGDREFIHQVTVQDTKAPTLKKTSDMKLFYGDIISTELLMGLCEVKDASEPVEFKILSAKDEITVSDALMANGKASIPVIVTDAQGNSLETELVFDVITNGDMPEWYQFFYAEAPEEEAAWIREYIRSGVSEDELIMNLFYYDSLEEAKQVLAEAVKGYKNAYYCGLLDNIDIEDAAWYGEELVGFYAGLGLMPEEVLRKYDSLQWTVRLCEDKLYLGDMECAGITYYGEKTIHITSDCGGTEWQRTTTIHEFGHFVDSAFYNYRSDGKVMTDAKNKAMESYHITEEFMDEWRSTVNNYDKLYYEYEDGGYRYYSFSQPAEFFADSFYFYCAHKEELKERFPDVYWEMQRIIYE